MNYLVFLWLQMYEVGAEVSLETQFITSEAANNLSFAKFLRVTDVMEG